MEYPHLFTPIKIGPVEIKNRIVMAPMLTRMANSDGSVSEQELCYYAARAKGGVGLIITGVYMTSRRAWDQQTIRAGALFDRGIHLAGACELAETIHSFGSKVFIQLSPGLGRQQGYSKTPLYSASPDIPLDSMWTAKTRPESIKPFIAVGPKFKSVFGKVPVAMTVTEIEDEIKNYIQSVDLAVVAGFDGLEVHAPHGYLLHQFLSPRTNKRNDQYGGTLENRCRFLQEIVTGVRREFGPDLPISVRLSSAEHVEGGFTPEDMREYARICEAAGANVIHLSDGCHEAFNYYSPDQENTHILEEQGWKLKAAVKIPVISMSIHDADLAEKAIAEGKTDMISAGRAFMADPAWPDKVREGRLKEIVRCQRENACTTVSQRGSPLRCILNPDLGRERYMSEYWPQKRSLRIPETLARVRGITQEYIESPGTHHKFKILDK
jgi:2,4-dienoyl-CoA reductase-like NADH-dependent reductase (Old Yellow Enzyme family)